MNDGAYQVDLTNCDREPIHILGAIQPFGFLLALSTDWLVARASANVAQFLGRGPDELLGLPLLALFTSDAVHAIRNRLTLLRGADTAERLFALALTENDRAYDVTLHLSDGQVVIEAEPVQTENGDSAGTIRAMMGRLDQAQDVTAFLREGARQVRALTGFDRVMVYRFDSDGAGEVVAEAARSGIGSFLGLHYPASDIPAQARSLYIRNLFRIIADVAAPPVPIVPSLDPAGAPLDLSLAGLRAVSPIHIEYLTNMGVGASLSISIVIDGHLWGLFACHHYAPRLPSLERRSLAELFGQMFAMKLESRERQAAGDYADGARRIADRLLAQVAGDATLLDDPTWLAETINEVIAADGVGVSIGGRIALSGLTPPPQAFNRLVRLLNGAAAGKVHAVDSITAILPEAAEYSDVAAGMLALPISRSPRDYIILFRQEIVRTVRWAGDPHKPAEFGPNGPRLTPRKSFETWSELVRGRSKPFTPAEVRIAETLRATLIEVVLRLSDDAHAERQLASERQDLLIAELNHRVRNILSLIRGLVRQSRGSACSVDAFVGEIDGRIEALARAHNQITRDQWGPAALRGLIETEAAAYLAGDAHRVGAEGPDIVLNPQAFSTLALVFHELMTNSAKYGALSDSGRVAVEWRLNADGSLMIDWQESGGPTIAHPTRQGFGTTIITRSIPYDLGGQAEVAYDPAGFTARFCVPSRHVGERAADDHGAAGRQANADRDIFAADARIIGGGTLLLVEDSLIIAMDAEDILLRLGASRVAAASTVEQALAEIERDRPTAAMLDINLGAQTSFAVADRLKALDIPYLFATGYGEQIALPEAHADVAVLQKPYSIDGVAAGLGPLLRP